MSFFCSRVNRCNTSARIVLFVRGVIDGLLEIAATISKVGGADVDLGVNFSFCSSKCTNVRLTGNVHMSGHWNCVKLVTKYSDLIQ